MVYEEMRKQFHHYIEHQVDYVEKYNGRVIVLKALKVIGVYDSEFEAVEKTSADGHELGTFLVQMVTPGPEAYTINIATPYLLNG